MTILIVDDDANLRMTLSAILQARGYASKAVGTAEAALHAVEEQVPEIAMIDLKLEDMSGLELMKKIRERSPGTECIVLTGHASQASAIEAVNLGAYSYVQKPYDVNQLLVAGSLCGSRECARFRDGGRRLGADDGARHRHRNPR